MRVGLAGEFRLAGSTSAQAVRTVMEIAVDEINAAGDVLGGRPLALVTRDNRILPAHAARIRRELAQMPDLVAAFCGRFSPKALGTVP